MLISVYLQLRVIMNRNVNLMGKAGLALFKGSHGGF
jgi:hypothetical protein